MEQSFTFASMPRLIFGPGSVDRLGEYAAGFGQVALLVVGAGALVRSGRLSRIVKNLQGSGLQVHQCSIVGEPTPEMIDTAVDACRDNNPNLVLAIGGGSVLDASKAIAAMLKAEGSVKDFLEGVGTRTPSGRSLPVIAVPTTSGTGSEATKNAVISQVGEGGFKKSLRHDNYIPKLAVLDPELCTTAPLEITAACGMDALTQLIESYVSTRASTLTDALAVEGLRYLIPALPKACGEGAGDLDCRGAVAYGAFLSGVTLANAGLGVVHGVAGPLGGLVPTPHGVACANLLPSAVKLTVENLFDADTGESRNSIAKFSRIANLLGASHNNPADGCSHLVDALYGWLENFKIPRLGVFGMTVRKVDLLMKQASNKNNPLPLSAGQIRQMILDRC
jgi:alcohol dehydrogenase class IV